MQVRELKLLLGVRKKLKKSSHLMQVRELKPANFQLAMAVNPSHLMQVRELKHADYGKNIFYKSRTSCRCVN